MQGDLFLNTLRPAGHLPENALYIYRSSAGSGKTYTLVRQYLRLVLPRPGSFRHVLAITFTNKATAEMKRRIVQALHELAEGKSTPFAADLAAALPGLNLRDAARDTLAGILHDYSHFGVQTIESFFYGIVKAFQRELQLQYGAELELETDAALEFVLDGLLAEVGSDNDLTDWLSDYIYRKMDDARSWNIEADVARLAKQLFTEPVQQLFRQGHTVTIPRVKGLVDELHAMRRRFKSELARQGHEALSLMETYSLDVADFAYGTGGVAGWLAKLAAGEVQAPGVRVLGAVEDAATWAAKSSPKHAQIRDAVAAGLQDVLLQAVDFYRQQAPVVSAGEAVLQQVYIYPLLSRLQDKLAAYRDEHRVLLISDIGQLLEKVIGDSDAPFIYEKTGTRIQHYLIDEFQDTSRRQWRNLQPLVRDAIAMGNSALVVGDAKQSIYRWRSGDMQLLLDLDRVFPGFEALVQAQVLQVNRRSGGHIVMFNNVLFKAAAQLVATRLGPPDDERVREAYAPAQVVQDINPQMADQGYVQIDFLPKPPTAEHTWKDVANDRLVALLTQLCAEGYAWGDIAILTRTNTDATRIAQHLLAQPVPFPVVSSESLLVQNSPHVQLLLSAMELLVNPGHKVAEAHLRYLLAGRQATAFDPRFAQNVLAPLFANRAALLRLPVYELGEQLAWLLPMPAMPTAPAEPAKPAEPAEPTADPFVLRFLDVLLEYQRQEAGDAMRFVHWWAANGHRYRLEMPEGAAAVSILTLHKAKGLEFPVVLIPYCEWEFDPDTTKEVLWARGAKAPFADFEALPVQASKSPEPGAPFYDDHRQELCASHLDNLNLLYVALTRPVERLYLSTPAYQPNPKQAHPYTCVSQLLHHALCADERLRAHYDVPAGVFRYGQVCARQPATEAQAAKMQLRPAAVGTAAWRDQISIRRRAQELAGLPAGQLDARAYGQLVHEALALLDHRDKLPAVLERLLFRGLLAETDLPAFRARLEAILALPEVDSWFDDTWALRSEAEILLPDGSWIRPDRVLMRDGAAAVVDFKTGLPEPSHVRQVKRYADALASMGYAPVHAYLLYVSEPKVVAV